MPPCMDVSSLGLACAFLVLDAAIFGLLLLFICRWFQSGLVLKADKTTSLVGRDWRVGTYAEESPIG